MGDVLQINKDEVFPADLLLLYAENDKGEFQDTIFVDTMNLDGETNLKPKEVIDPSMSSERDFVDMVGTLTYDLPNKNLAEWEGKLEYDGKNGHTKRPGSINNLLLRGCTLKKVTKAFGVVIYVGRQTKIMMNAKKPPVKVSHLMKLMNYFLLSVFFLQLVLIVTFASLSVGWKAVNKAKEYTSSSDNSEITVNVGTWFIQLLTYWVAYSHMIPISLYVMIEVMKLLLSKLINKDEAMRDPDTKMYSDVRNSDLIEELGQVQFVFSDKTGTLTQNKMEFKKFSVDRKIFPDNVQNIDGTNGSYKDYMLQEGETG